ncbi:MAG: carboxypeptidase regulatory-like domain-containing protein [Dysgonamonadaceae bacterium]|jgi:hypothetical protein|nr:carboxypeptidase regulatory-like domain-containing protein [Dysgonamonadaceae bacterium]
MKKTCFIGAIIAFFAAGFFFLQSCEEKPIEVKGNIEGTVTDAETANAISGVNVTIVSNSSTTFAEQSKQTGSDGKFSFKDLEAGSYKLSFSKNGYEDNSKNISLTAGQTSSGDVSLKPVNPVLNVSTTMLDFGLNTSILPIEIRNSGKGEMEWSIIENLAWLSVNPASGRITTGVSSVSVTIDRSSINQESLTGSFVVNSNGGSTVVNVSVGMKVTAPSAPEVINGQATGITSSTAQVSGNITSIGSSAITQHGHCWSASPNPTTDNSKTSLGGTSVPKSFTSDITGLNPSTTYYVRAYATNAVGTSYSDVVTFTMLAPPTMPTVQTLNVSNIKDNSLNATGNLTVLGDGLVTAHGFCYSSSNSEPTTDDNKISKGQTSQTGQFTVTIPGLQASTRYYLRAYATNSMGTAYGTVIEATTASAPSSTTVVTGGLTAYYTFDDGSATDVTGNGYDGALINSPEFIDDVPGEKGKAVFLRKANGTTILNDQRINLPNPIKNQSSYTVCLWIKDFGSGIMLWGDVSQNYVYGIPNFYVDAGKFYADGHGYDDATNFQDGQWHHIVFSAKQYYTEILYVDGIAYGSQTSSQKPNSVTVQIGGKTNFTASYNNANNFKTDNIRFYDRELSASEVKQIYNARQ